MSIFNNIEKVESLNSRDRHPFIQAGEHDLTLIEVVKFKNREDQEKFKATFSVDRSTVHETGSKVTFMLGFDRYVESRKQELRTFMDVLFKAKLGDDFKEALVTEANCEDAVGPDQPLRGVRVHSNAYTSGNSDFVKNSWSPILD